MTTTKINKKTTTETTFLDILYIYLFTKLFSGRIRGQLNLIKKQGILFGSVVWSNYVILYVIFVPQLNIVKLQVDGTSSILCILSSNKSPQYTVKYFQRI